MTISHELRAALDDEPPGKWIPVDGVRLPYRGIRKSKSGATFENFDVIVVHQSTDTEESFQCHSKT